MTEPDQHTDMPAALRLSVAIDQLIQPGVQHLDRDEAAAQAALDQLDREHTAALAVLRARHAGRRRADLAGRTRDMDALTRAGDEHRTERARLEAGMQPAIVTTPSLLDQLLSAIHSTGGTNGASGAGAHRSPIGLAATHAIWAHGTPLDPYVGPGAYLGARDGQHIAELLRKWEADSVHSDHDAHLAEQWVAAARDVVTPSRRFEVIWPCPICGAARTWTRDEDGQSVAQAALQVDYQTGVIRCTAPTCTARWTRDYHDHFLRLVNHRDDDPEVCLPDPGHAPRTT